MTAMPITVDASVAVKWVLAEEHADRAAVLLNDSLGRPLLGPPHLAGEVTNAIFQRYRRGHLTGQDAERALSRFLAIGVDLVSPSGLYEEALAFATAKGLKGTYDSLYVVLARMVGSDLSTDDRELLKTVASGAPWVRWIGNYPLPKAPS